MSWCKDYCLVCERETRVENGITIPYCSQACRLADYDKRDEPLLSCSANSNSSWCGVRERSGSSGMPYIDPASKEMFLFPSPPSNADLCPDRPRRISSSKSGSGSSVASFNNRASLNLALDPTPEVFRPGYPFNSGSVFARQKRRCPSLTLNVGERAFELLNSPTGGIFSFEPSLLPPSSSSPTCTSPTDVGGFFDPGDVCRRRCESLQYYASCFDQERYRRKRRTWQQIGYP